MKRFIIALMIVCMAIGLASCNQYPPPPPLFGGDDPGIVMITTYQQMKSLLSGSGSGTYYLDSVPFAADAEAVDVNGKKNILGSVDVNGAGTRVVAKGIAAKADPSETSESIVIFRIADSAEVSFSDFTANVKASVTENVEIISVDAGKLSASNVKVETESTASVVGIAIGTNATAENISVVNSASASITIAEGNENALDIVESIRQENPDSTDTPAISTEYDVSNETGFAAKLMELNQVRLIDDVSLSGLALSEGNEYVIDLNGNELLITTQATSIIIPANSDVTFKNGNLVTNSNEAAVNLANIGINDSAVLRFDGVTYTGNAAGIGPNRNSTFIMTNRSSITTEGAYAIATNASTDDTGELLDGNVTISIDDSTVTAVDGMAICFNVTGSVEINKSIINGVWTAVMIRGGNAIITDSRLSATCDYTDPAFESQDWGSGNMVPFGTLVIGNRSASYKYPTTCYVDDLTTISMSGTGTNIYEVYIASSNGADCSVSATLPAVYVNEVLNVDKSYWLRNPETDVLTINGDQIKNNPN